MTACYPDKPLMSEVSDRESALCSDDSDGLDDYHGSAGPYEELDQGTVAGILKRRGQAGIEAAAGCSPDPSALDPSMPDPSMPDPAMIDSSGRMAPTLPQPPDVSELSESALGGAAVRHDSQTCPYRGEDPAVCGCCLRVCPTHAIGDMGGTISIDHAACIGCGVCAAVCPTGAMAYRRPSPSDLLVTVHGRLADAGLEAPAAPTVILHQPLPRENSNREYRAYEERADGGRPTIEVALPAIGCAGPEVWLGALAYGADQVVVRLPVDYPETLARVLFEQHQWVAAALAGAGVSPERLQLIGDGRPICRPAEPMPPTFPAADFSPFQSKRKLIRNSVAHLAAGAGRSAGAVALPAGAPFGAVTVDPEACTLCMACVGGCPTAALAAPGASPLLNFRESECIQCEACRRICPEQALTIKPRMELDTTRAERPRRLHGQAALACIGCGRDFAPPGLIARLAQRLEGHSMFATADQKRRLNMCRECRVRDLLTGGGERGVP